MTDTNGEVEIKDFTLAPKPMKFKIDNDIFEAVHTIPLGFLGDLVKAAKTTATEDGATEMILSVFDVMLHDASAALFRKRAVDKENPIGFAHLQPLLMWLLEKHGLRPTQPSSDSSTVSPVPDGTSSTAGVDRVELTPPVSPSPDSSISSTDSSTS
jgi:hypothetical protein